MRFTVSVPVFVLSAAAAAAAGTCAVCPTFLLPGPSEVAWSLVFNRDIAENQMFCGFRGTERGNPNPVQTFCMYYDNNGTKIENDESLQACPQTVAVTSCNN